MTLVFARDVKGQCCALDLGLYSITRDVFLVTTLIRMEKLSTKALGLDKSPYVQQLDSVCRAHRDPPSAIISLFIFYTRPESLTIAPDTGSMIEYDPCVAVDDITCFSGLRPSRYAISCRACLYTVLRAVSSIPQNDARKTLQV
jgi:hypothetical protein